MFKVLGVAIGLLIVASLLWIGSEMHYENCLDRAKEVPVGGFDRFRENESDVPSRRTERMDGCSRSPF